MSEADVAADPVLDPGTQSVPQGRPGRHARATAWLGIMVALLASATLIGAWATDPPRRSTDSRLFVIPPGTGERAEAGEPIDDILPQVITTSVGTSLVVQNEDVVRHVFGPFVLDPGQRWQRDFAVTGEYGFTCSLYPVAGFTIDVGPAAGTDRPSTTRWAAGGWSAASVLVLIALSGTLGTATAAGGGLSPWAGRLAVVQLPTVLGAVGGGLLLLSRVAQWGTVLVSRAALAWIGAGVASVALAALGWRMLRPDARARPERTLPLLLLILVLVAVGAWPTVGLPDGPRIGLATLGAGLLTVAWIGEWRGGPARELRHAAVVGFVAVLVALPIPLRLLTPPVHGVVAIPALLAGVGLLVWAGRLYVAPDGGWLVRFGGGAVVLFATATLWWASIRHLDAVSLPLWGNPVADSAASVAEGSALWRAHCADCHEEPAQYAEIDDRRLLQVITHGAEGMPGFAYTLDVRERGHVVNFLRSVGEAPDRTRPARTRPAPEAAIRTGRPRRARTSPGSSR